MYPARVYSRCAMAAAVLLSCPLLASADYISASTVLDQSNGPYNVFNFGSVRFEANSGSVGSVNGVSAGQVRITFAAALIPDYGKPGPHFGFDAVAFNTNLNLLPDQVSSPASWKLTPNASTPFGEFAWKLSTPIASARAETVTVVISGLGNQAVPGNFFLYSLGPPGFDTVPPPPVGMFAGHVMDYTGVPTPFNPAGGPVDSWTASDHWPVASESPEPSSLVLGGVALGALGLSWIRRRLRIDATSRKSS